MFEKMPLLQMPENRNERKSAIIVLQLPLNKMA